jgi:hypothetical protein
MKEVFPMMDSMGDGGSTATTLLMLLVWLLTLAAAFAGGWLVAHRGLPARLVSGGSGDILARSLTEAPHDEAEALLRHRLAAGEIDDDEFLRLRSALESRWS